jgi:hypothetical protein
MYKNVVIQRSIIDIQKASFLEFTVFDYERCSELLSLISDNYSSARPNYTSAALNCFVPVTRAPLNHV